MVRQKVRSQFSLSQKKKKKKTHGKEKGKNLILTFEKNHMVRQKVRTRFLFFKKETHGKAKANNSNHTFEMKNHWVGQE